MSGRYDTPRQREHLPATVNTSQPASARFAQSYVFTANDAFVFISSVGGHRWSPGWHQAAGTTTCAAAGRAALEAMAASQGCGG